MSPIPDESIKRVPLSFGVINVWVYGMNSWGDLFNHRQKLSLIVFADKIKEVHANISKDMDKDYANAITTYLALIFSRTTDYCSNLASWITQVENPSHVFTRLSLGMTWNYFEINLFSPVSQGTWTSMLKQVIKPLENLSEMEYSSNINLSNSSATNLPFEDNFFDAVFTRALL